MKEVSQYQAGMAFYGQMPDMYNLVLNTDHPLIKNVLEHENAACADTLKPVTSEIKGLEARLAVLHQEQNKKKPEEITQKEKDDVRDTEKQIEQQRNKKNEIIAASAKDKPTSVSSAGVFLKAFSTVSMRTFFTRSMSSPFFTMAPNITKLGHFADMAQPKTWPAIPVSTSAL